MFDNPNQYNMFSGGPLSTPTFPPAPGSYYSITGGAPNVPGQVIPPVVPAQQNTQVPFGATHVSDKSAGPKYSYLPGSYEIILDAEYTDNFIINSARSKSIMEKYTEAIARITYFFESQKRAKCEVTYEVNSPHPHIFITYANKYRTPVGTESYPVAEYSADNFMKDLEELKEMIKSFRK